MVGMLVVLVIIGIVFWWTMGGSGSGEGGFDPKETVERGRQAQVKTELRTLEQAIQLYRTKNGQYPPDLQTVVEDGSATKSAIRGPNGDLYNYNPETGEVSAN